MNDVMWCICGLVHFAEHQLLDHKGRRSCPRCRYFATELVACGKCADGYPVGELVRLDDVMWHGHIPPRVRMKLCPHIRCRTGYVGVTLEDEGWQPL